MYSIIRPSETLFHDVGRLRVCVMAFQTACKKDSENLPTGFVPPSLK
ncbi:hypothetical protein GJV52_08820 [Neisseria brasiliensis]|nr:hypothetical protein GJV52_08820 [Neisseria brasiliensis]